MPKYVKFTILTTVIIGALAWLAVGGIADTSTYYKTVTELQQMGPDKHEKRLRVAGDVAKGTIQRNGRVVTFTLKQETQVLNVRYDGIEPLPDTFRDGAQAVCDGKLGNDGVFHAKKIQAKCASKYEAKPGDYPGAKRDRAAS